VLTWLRMDQKEVLHSIRTAVAAVGSLLIARFCRLPESYWAAVTAIVIMQSTLGAAWTVSKQRFVGTALGAAMGALLTAYAAQNAAAFGAGVCVLGLALLWQIYSRRCSLQIHFRQCGHRCFGGSAISSRMA
jgi:uncharacterized membrane protein YccC